MAVGKMPCPRRRKWVSEKYRYCGWCGYAFFDELGRRKGVVPDGFSEWLWGLKIIRTVMYCSSSRDAA